MSDIKTLQNLVDQMSEIQKEMEEIQNGGKMKYVIARPINGISLNGNEYLLDDNNEVLEFKTKEECIKHCESVGLDDSYVWEEEK